MRCYPHFNLFMARSLGFGSTALYLFALLRLAFASAPCFPLNLAQYHNSPAHSAKGTLSPVNGLELFVSIWFQILYFTPLPGFFSPFPHGTMRYRSLSSILPWMVVHPASHKVSRVSWYSGYRPIGNPFAYGSFTFCARLSQVVQLKFLPFMPVLNPGGPKTSGLGYARFARRYWGHLV